MDKLLFATKLIGIGLIIASVCVALLTPEPEAEHILGLLGLGLILDGRVAEVINDINPSKEADNG